jgi:hypothetical protein
MNGVLRRGGKRKRNIGRIKIVSNHKGTRGYDDKRK